MGILIFRSLKAALKEGYQVCGRYEKGYTVRIRTNAGWQMALVEV